MRKSALGLSKHPETLSNGDYVRIKSGKFKGVEGHLKKHGKKKYFDIFVTKPDPRMTGLGMVIDIKKENLKKMQ